MVDISEKLRKQLAKVNRATPCHYALERYFRELRRLVISVEVLSNTPQIGIREKVFMVFTGVEYIQVIPKWEDAPFDLVAGEERNELLHQFQVIGDEQYPRVFRAQPNRSPIIVVCSIVQVLNSLPLN